jgi:hypothetical protein
MLPVAQRYRPGSTGYMGWQEVHLMIDVAKPTLVQRYDLKKVRRSALIVSACVVAMPWGKRPYRS